MRHSPAQHGIIQFQVEKDEPITTNPNVGGFGQEEKECILQDTRQRLQISLPVVLHTVDHCRLCHARTFMSSDFCLKHDHA